ncbi:hypothetical protein GCM10017687_66110 [Streptomyces echinatus]
MRTAQGAHGIVKRRLAVNKRAVQVEEGEGHAGDSTYGYSCADACSSTALTDGSPEPSAADMPSNALAGAAFYVQFEITRKGE